MVTPDARPGSEPVHLIVRRTPALTPDRIAGALGHGADGWLGPRVPEGAPPGMRRYLTDLRLRVSDSPSLVTFRKAAYVDLGAPRPIADGWEIEISWHAATLAPLFPVFSGVIVVRPDELTLSGWYAPPGGELGRIADRVLLHIAANGTARWFLGELEQAAGKH